MSPKNKKESLWYIYECNVDQFDGYWILYQQVGENYFKVAHSLINEGFVKGKAKKVKLTPKEIDTVQEDLAMNKTKGNYVTFQIAEKTAAKILKELKYKNVGKE